MSMKMSSDLTCESWFWRVQRGNQKWCEGYIEYKCKTTRKQNAFPDDRNEKRQRNSKG